MGEDLDQSGIYTTPNIGTLLCVRACVARGGMVGLIVLVRRPCVYPRGWWEVSWREHRGSCWPASEYHRHSLLSEIKVITRTDELAEQTLAPSSTHTHVSTWQRGTERRWREGRPLQVSLMGLLCVCRLCGNTILSPNGT